MQEGNEKCMQNFVRKLGSNSGNVAADGRGILQHWITLRSTLKFQRCFSRHFMGIGFSKASKGLSNATIVTNATMAS
jgi:hypothetical protein